MTAPALNLTPSLGRPTFAPAGANECGSLAPILFRLALRRRAEVFGVIETALGAHFRTARRRVGAKTRTPPECGAGSREPSCTGFWRDGWRAPLGKHMGAPDVPHGTSGTNRGAAGCLRARCISAPRTAQRGQPKRRVRR